MTLVVIALQTVLLATAVRPLQLDHLERIPFELEVIPGALHCAPGQSAFDEGLRAAVGQDSLDVDPGRHSDPRQPRRIANRFCFASLRSRITPIRVSLKLRSDASAIADYFAGSTQDTSQVHRQEHILIEGTMRREAQLQVHRARFRSSFWMGDVSRDDYCWIAGRNLALLVLEALHQDTGHLDKRQRLRLIPVFSRDSVYSEAP